jgi:membrane dipeptidase
LSKKNYNGFKSFQYLEPGVDYKPFKLAKEINRVEPYTVDVSANQEAQVQKILDEEIVVSLHDHSFIVPEDTSEIWDYLREGRCRTAYEALSVSHIDILFENFLDGITMITSKAGWKWTDIIHDIGIHFADFFHSDMLYLALTVDDLYRAKKEGKIAAVATLEAATAIENELDRVDVLYGLGIRCMGITYSESNALGSGLKEPGDGGLTRFGHQVVRRMNQLGMAIDVSHCGDKTALDTIEASDKPVFITHAGARSLWNTNRLMPDDVLKACAEKGGVIGIEAAPHTTLTAEHPLHCIDSFMQHFEYIANLVGIEHVAFGPDTLFGDHVELHRTFAAALSIKESRAGKEFEEVDYVKGLENPAECFPNITRWLVKNGYSQQDIAKVLGQNIIRVLKDNWIR